MAETTSCENALLAISGTRGRLDRCSVELHYGNQLQGRNYDRQFLAQPCDYQ